MDEFVLMTLLVVIANGIFDAVFVAWVAGKRSKTALVSWMESPEAVPYMDKIANRAMLQIRPEISGISEDLTGKISGIETRISTDLTSKISTDLGSQRSAVTADLNRMTEKIETSISDLVDPIALKVETIAAYMHAPLEIPPLDLNPLLAEIRGMMIEQTRGLRDELLDSVKKSQMAMQSAANRALQGQLDGIDDMVDQYGEAIIEESVARGNPSDMIIAQIMSSSVSKKYEKEHPAGAMVLKLGKAAAVQAVQAGQIPGFGGFINGNEQLNKGQSLTKLKSSPFE